MKIRIWMLPVILCGLILTCSKENRLLNCPAGCQCWERICASGNDSDSFVRIVFIDRDTGWRVGREGRIEKTIDGGISWVSQVSGTQNGLQCIAFLDSKTGFVTGFENTLLKTTDGGSSWTPVLIPQDSLAHNGGITFSDSNTGWFIDNLGTLYRTVNGGNDWTPVWAFPGLGWSQVGFLNPEFGFATKMSGSSFFLTHDGGTSWDRVDPVFPGAQMAIDIHDLDFVTEDIAYYCCSWLSGGHRETATPVVKTEDGGQTWFVLDSLPTPVLQALHFTDARSGWIAGQAFYGTEDAGASWHRFRDAADKDFIVDLFFLDKNHGWALSRNGSVYRYDAR